LENKQEIINSIDPNGVGENGKLFGLPFSADQADVVLLPIPWEVTVSYGAGAMDGSQAILEASSQIDLFVREIPNAWQMGVHMLPLSAAIAEENIRNRDLATQYITQLEAGKQVTDALEMKVIPQTINEVCEKLNIYVQKLVEEQLNKGKIVGVIGGDHSTSLGLIRALNNRYESFGILQIDAHADLRRAYQGFTYSHASIMHNALKCKNVSKLVQVGVRDCCEQEAQVISASNGRITTFFDDEIKEALYLGNQWGKLCAQIVEQLPEHVYISFDIDGLDPRFCPHTGTPVPGGLDFQEAAYLIKALVKSGRKIIGFDLSEVAPGNGDWDGNVGARMLYHMSNWAGVSQGLLRSR
jgi:agmatinase